MSQEYLAALWEETSAWRDVDEAIQEQRSAIINRQAEAIWESQDRLQELLRRAAVCRNSSSGLRPGEVDGETEAIEAMVVNVRRQVRDALRLNHELLRDLCHYLDMIREVAFAHTLPPTYTDPRHERGSEHEVGIIRNRTA